MARNYRPRINYRRIISAARKAGRSAARSASRGGGIMRFFKKYWLWLAAAAAVWLFFKKDMIALYQKNRPGANEN